MFYLLSEGMVALELEEPDHVLRVQTLYAGDELDWSAVLPNAGKHFQARALRPVTALAFEGGQLLGASSATRTSAWPSCCACWAWCPSGCAPRGVQLLDMYSPVAKRAGT